MMEACVCYQTAWFKLQIVDDIYDQNAWFTGQNWWSAYATPTYAASSEGKFFRLSERGHGFYLLVVTEGDANKDRQEMKDKLKLYGLKS